MALLLVLDGVLRIEYEYHRRLSTSTKRQELRMRRHSAKSLRPTSFAIIETNTIKQNLRLHVVGLAGMQNNWDSILPKATPTDADELFE